MKLKKRVMRIEGMCKGLNEAPIPPLPTFPNTYPLLLRANQPGCPELHAFPHAPPTAIPFCRWWL